MARKLKLFFVGLVVSVSGLVMIVCSMFTTHYLTSPISTYSQKKFSFLVWSVLFVGGILSIALGSEILGSKWSCTLSDFRLALRWRWVVDRPFSEFPLERELREAFRGGAEAMLIAQASDVSMNFKLRDVQINHLTSLREGEYFFAHSPNSDSTDIPKLRKWQLEASNGIREAARNVEVFKEAADHSWKIFLRLWDFFKDMEMLPSNPATQTTWNPNDFRLYAKQASESAEKNAATAQVTS